MRTHPALPASILILLVAAPLALGAVHEPAFIPLLVGVSLCGLASWWRGYRQSGWTPRALPGGRAILAFGALVAAQTIPLPWWLLRLVSPGSLAQRQADALVPLRGFYPISMNALDTGRGLAFWIGFALLYLAAYRELSAPEWRTRVCKAVALTGALMTLIALVQAASANPHKIYGLWQPLFSWAVFGPYVNRNYFANYLGMATALAVGLLVTALAELSVVWRRRRPGWLALGEPAGTAALRWGAVMMTCVVGLIASGSRGGVASAALTLCLLLLLFRRTWLVSLALVIVLVVAFSLADFGTLWGSLERAGFQSRWIIWKDAIRLFPAFPVLGAGFNAFGTAFTPLQHVPYGEWVGQAHNEYLQVLVDTGLVGAGLVASLLIALLRRAIRLASRSPLDAGLFAAILSCGLHNVVDFNWQIPANAATFVALAALIMAPRAASRHEHSRAERGASGPIGKLDALGGGT